MIRIIGAFALLLALLQPAQAQDFPALSGRVVDQAGLLSPDDEAALTQKLAALEQATTRQLVVATVTSLAGRPIEDYAVSLGRHWGIGQRDADNGVLLLVAPNERKVRIEVGYGLEGILTDALTSSIIRNQITTRFRENDFAGGISAGADAIIAQLEAPPEAAEERVRAAADEQRAARSGAGQGSWVPFAFWGVILLIIFASSAFGRRGHGRRFRHGSGIGHIVLWGLVNSLASGGRGGGGWGSGGRGGWGGGGGGFSGGGGSFGGGGASGSW